MPAALAFLVVDDNRDNRFLLTKTLARKFPGCRIYECGDSDEALKIARESMLAAAIIHRTADLEGVHMVELLRKERPSLPILAVSGYDRRQAAFRAGANAFLHYDAWLSLGLAIDDMLGSAGDRNPPMAPGDEGVYSSGAAVRGFTCTGK